MQVGDAEIESVLLLAESDALGVRLMVAVRGALPGLQLRDVVRDTVDAVALGLGVAVPADKLKDCVPGLGVREVPDGVYDVVHVYELMEGVSGGVREPGVQVPLREVCDIDGRVGLSLGLGVGDSLGELLWLSVNVEVREGVLDVGVPSVPVALWLCVCVVVAERVAVETD